MVNWFKARSLAQIQHIEIPGFVDFFALGPEGQQTLYLVTYWVNGITLSEKLAQGWQPTVDYMVPEQLQGLHRQYQAAG